MGSQPQRQPSPALYPGSSSPSWVVTVTPDTTDPGLTGQRRSPRAQKSKTPVTALQGL